MSMDGCIAGSNNEMDWLVWDDNYIEYLKEITESVGLGADSSYIVWTIAVHFTCIM